MLNYIRSELYRIFHRPGVYVTALILCGLTIAINSFLAFFPWEDYGEAVRENVALTGISYAGLLSGAALFIPMGAVVAALLYTTVSRHGDLKNTVAFGLSRVTVFACKSIITILIATLLLALTYGVWILCASLLLEHGGPCTIIDLLFQVFALYLIACANALTVLLCFELFRRESIAFLAYIIVWVSIPVMLNTLGLHFDFIAQISGWLPYNFLQNTADPTTVASTTLANAGGTVSISVNQTMGYIWTSAEGLRKCLISGACGVTFCALAGWLALRRRDI